MTRKINAKTSILFLLLEPPSQLFDCSRIKGHFVDRVTEKTSGKTRLVRLQVLQNISFNAEYRIFFSLLLLFIQPLSMFNISLHSSDHPKWVLELTELKFELIVAARGFIQLYNNEIACNALTSVRTLYIHFYDNSSCLMVWIPIVCI